jgi:serine/threonine-protein kinase
MSTDKVCPVCGATYGPDHLFCPRDSSALRSADETDGLVGTVIGQRYLLTERIGAGGMGEVYKAQDVRLPRIVAVKIMRPHLAGDPDSIARVIREAANGSRIRHPNVVDISDYGETADGRPYLAMEFIAGESLRSLLNREGVLDPGRAAALLLQIASGLDAAHRLGIVHRDMKPDNVLVHVGDDGTERAKVVDFGISRAIRDESQHLTKTGFITGTCEFMSPEQVAGRAFDHHSDIYSLGLVAFQMVTGGLPFAGETPELAMLARLHESPRRLDEVRPSGHWARGIQEAVDRALAREVGERFDSAGEFARAFADAANPPTSTMAATPLRRPAPARLGRMGWKIPLAAAGIAAAAVIGMVVWDGGGRVSPPAGEPKIVPEPPKPAGQEIGEAPMRPPSPVDTAPVTAAPQPEPAPQPKPAPKKLPPPAVEAPPQSQLRADIDAYEKHLQPGVTADSARRVIASLESLIPRLTTRRDSVEADIYRAEAYALAGDDKQACAILETALPRANTLQRRKVELWVDQGLCKSPEWKSS